jgi:hypothetical protein
MANLMKICLSRSRVLPCGRTDRDGYDDANSCCSQIFRTRLKMQRVNLSLFITARHMERVNMAVLTLARDGGERIALEKVEVSRPGRESNKISCLSVRSLITIRTRYPRFP